MVAYVNGYMCFNKCQEASARHGHDPAKPEAWLPDGSDESKKSAFDTHATVFGGSLKDRLAGKADATDATGASDATADPGGIAKPTVDILA